MPLSGEVLVEDLCRLTAEDLKSRSYFKLKDPSNLTAEHVEELRNLVNGIDKSHPVDVDALDERLRNIASGPATDSVSGSSSAQTPELEDLMEDFLREEREARDALVLDGGRPSHPIDSGFDVLKEPGQYAEIISYWSRGGSGLGVFCDQFRVWREFREYQERARRSQTDPERFAKYTQYVRDYRRKKGLEGDIELHEDPKKQTRLDDWKEYQVYQLRAADRFTRDMRYAEKRLERSQERLRAAVEAGQSAQSIEWIKEYGIEYWQGRRGTARRLLEKHNVLLRWIDQQLPIIASECGSSGQGSKPFHRGNSAEANAVSEEPRLGSEAAKHSIHQPNPAPASRKRKRSMDESTPCTSTLQKVRKHIAATHVCERRELDIIPSASLPSDIHANSRDGDHFAEPQRQDHAGQPRRSQRIAKLKKGAPVLEPGALSSAIMPKVQRASAGEDRRAVRSSVKRPSGVVKATDRSLPARCLRERRRERWRPIPPVFELGLESKTPLGEGGLRRSKRIWEKCRKALTPAQELPC